MSNHPSYNSAPRRLTWKGKLALPIFGGRHPDTRGFSLDYKVDIRTAWQDKPWDGMDRQLQELVDCQYVLKPQHKLKEICDRLCIPFYDLYPDMNAGVFLADGVQLNAVGRRVVGQRVAAFLAQSNLLPADKSEAKTKQCAAEFTGSHPASLLLVRAMCLFHR